MQIVQEVHEEDYNKTNRLLNYGCRSWSDKKPHTFGETNTQFPQKDNFGNSIIGPSFIE